MDHPVALAELAEMHANGLGTPLDKAKAFECAVRSAEAGYPQGQFYLAECYKSGMGVEQNQELAYEWLSKSAEQFHPEAMLALANAITTGHTTAFSMQVAKTYLNHCLHSPYLQNHAMVSYAKYLLDFEPGIEGMIGAVLMFKECFESESADSEHSKQSVTLGRRTITEIRQSIPKLACRPKLMESAVTVSAYYDEQGYPYKNRAERQAMIMDMSRSHREGRKTPGYLSSLGIITDQPKQGRNESCACNSGKKYKACHGK